MRITLMLAFAFLCFVGPACAPIDTHQSFNLSGTLSTCAEPNPRDSSTTAALPSRQAVLDVVADGATFAERVVPVGASDDAGWSVSTATHVSNVDVHLDVDGAFVEGCDADGGCHSVPWSLKLTQTDAGYAGTYAEGKTTCEAKLRAE